MSAGATTSTVDWALVGTALTGTVLPWVVALVTKCHWSSTVKGILLAVLSILTAVAAQVIDVLKSPATHPNWQNLILSALAAWAIGHVSYKSILKDLPVTGKLQAAGSGTQNDDTTPVTTEPNELALSDYEGDNTPVETESPHAISDADADGYSGSAASLGGGTTHLDEHPEGNSAPPPAPRPVP